MATTQRSRRVRKVAEHSSIPEIRGGKNVHAHVTLSLPVANRYDGWQAMRLIDAIYESSRRGRVVHVDP